MAELLQVRKSLAEKAASARTMMEMLAQFLLAEARQREITIFSEWPLMRNMCQEAFRT